MLEGYQFSSLLGMTVESWGSVDKFTETGSVLPLPKQTVCGAGLETVGRKWK